VDFAAKDNAHAVSLAAPDTLTGNTLWRLPAQDGTASQALCTDGAGNLGFCSTGGTPGGSTDAVQYRDASGAFAGTSNMLYDPTLQKFTLTGIAATAAIDAAAGFIQSEGGFNSNASAWNGIESATDGADLRGYTVRQNNAATAGGYVDFTPITYNPYGGSACFDQYGNQVNQPDPLPGISSFSLGTATSTFSSGATSIAVSAVPAGVAAYGQISGPGIPVGDYITGVSGTTISLAIPTSAAESGATLNFFGNELFLWNSASPEMPLNGSCGAPLPSNTLFGINTNGYLFARGGLATDIPYFNSIQSMVGGVFGRALFTSDIYNGTGATCGTIGTCGGAYYNTGGSSGVPTPIAGDSFHGGAFYWDTALSAQRTYNGSAWQANCLVPGATGDIVFDGGSSGCSETSNFTWTAASNTLSVKSTLSTLNPQLWINGTAASQRILRLLSGGSSRWALFADSDAESTGNVGSTLQITRYDNSGAAIDNPLSIARSTGVVTLADGTASSVFNSTATGATIGFQLNNNLFEVDGNGNVTASGQVSAAYHLLQKQASSPTVGTNLGGLWTNSSGSLAYRYQSGTAYAFLDSSGNITAENLTILGSCSGCPSGGGAVSSVVSGGLGISVSPTTGTVVVSNTGVTSLSGGTGVSVSGSTGGVTVSIGQPVASSNTPTFAGVWTTNAFNCQASFGAPYSFAGNQCAVQGSGTFKIFTSGDGQFQGLAANKYWVGGPPGTGTEGHTGSTCSAWTEGLCTAP
jgi:hypothetical protein